MITLYWVVLEYQIRSVSWLSIILASYEKDWLVSIVSRILLRQW